MDISKLVNGLGYFGVLLSLILLILGAYFAAGGFLAAGIIAGLVAGAAFLVKPFFA